jgi:hypothetical protein
MGKERGPRMIRRTILLVLTAQIFAPWALWAPVSASEAVLFVLKETESGFALKEVPIEDGEVKVFQIGRGHQTIDVILPVSPGQSGNVVQRSRSAHTVRVRRDGRELHTTVHREGGETRDYPTVSLTDLASYDIRVNVTGAGGGKTVFMIHRWEMATRDEGPVIDMFGGAIPLEPGDISVTVQTSHSEQKPRIEGTAPLDFSDGLLFTTGSIPPGVDGEFIVDFGATGSVIVRWFLPKSTEIREQKAVEYSDRGIRELDASLRAAGGEVEDYLGIATLEELHVGEITFPDADFNVIGEMPEFEGRMIVGVIGANLLHRAEVVSLGYKKDAGAGPVLRLSSESRHEGEDRIVELPINLAQRHIFLSGSVDGAPVSFLFDTGARRSIVTTEVVRKANLTMLMGPRLMVKGLDANVIPVGVIRPLTVTLGDTDFTEIPLAVADLPVLEALGLRESGGLLGNDILRRYREVEVDLADRVIRLVP